MFTAKTSSSTLAACGFDPWGRNLISGDFVAEAGIALLNHYEVGRKLESENFSSLSQSLFLLGKWPRQNYFAKKNHAQLTLAKVSFTILAPSGYL